MSRENDKNFNEGAIASLGQEKDVTGVAELDTQTLKCTETGTSRGNVLRKTKWSEKKMRKALEATRVGKLGVRAAARKYGIPHSTLVTRIEKLKRDKCYYLPFTKSRSEKQIHVSEATQSGSQNLSDQSVNIANPCQTANISTAPLSTASHPSKAVIHSCSSQSQHTLPVEKLKEGTDTDCSVTSKMLQSQKNQTKKALHIKKCKQKWKRTAPSEAVKSTKGLCKRRLWSEFDMAQACQACKEERYTISEAARIYGIPRPTLYMRLSGKGTPNVPLGRKTYLTPEEENRLEKRDHFPCEKKLHAHSRDGCFICYEVSQRAPTSF